MAQFCIAHIDQFNIHQSWTRLKSLLLVQTSHKSVGKCTLCLMVTFGCVFKLLCTKPSTLATLAAGVPDSRASIRLKSRPDHVLALPEIRRGVWISVMSKRPCSAPNTQDSKADSKLNHCHPCRLCLFAHKVLVHGGRDYPPSPTQGPQARVSPKSRPFRENIMRLMPQH